MRRSAVVLAVVALSTFFASNAAAIMITASSDVLAAECCNTGTVRVYNGLSITDSNKKWANEPFSHLWLATASWCDLTYNYFQALLSGGTVAIVVASVCSHVT
jgi:hypothetical protein